MGPEPTSMLFIAQAKEVLLLAFGENKTSSVAKAVEGPVTPAVPASFLQDHPKTTFYLDGAASAGMPCFLLLSQACTSARLLLLLTSHASISFFKACQHFSRHDPQTSPLRRQEAKVSDAAVHT